MFNRTKQSSLGKPFQNYWKIVIFTYRAFVFRRKYLWNAPSNGKFIRTRSRLIRFNAFAVRCSTDRKYFIISFRQPSSSGSISIFMFYVLKSKLELEIKDVHWFATATLIIYSRERLITSMLQCLLKQIKWNLCLHIDSNKIALNKPTNPHARICKEKSNTRTHCTWSVIERSLAYQCDLWFIECLKGI